MQWQNNLKQGMVIMNDSKRSFRAGNNNGKSS